MMRMLNAIKRVCLACPPRLGMHIGECDHACNMINNYVCFMLVDVCVPCTTPQPTGRIRMGGHKSHADARARNQTGMMMRK